MDPSQTKYPPMKDLTADNLTENVNLINSGCQNPRLKFLIEKLVEHVHDFCRETRLSMNEYMAVVTFLTAVGMFKQRGKINVKDAHIAIVGQKCTDTRQVSQNRDFGSRPRAMTYTGSHSASRCAGSFNACRFDRPPEAIRR